MNHLPTYLLSIAVILLTFSCSRQHPLPDDYTEKLAQARSLMDSIPDSALSIVRTLELNGRDNPAIASEAHYINGVSRLKLWDFKGAVRELLFAEKFADEAKAYSQLGDARMAICELYDSLNSLDGSAKYAIAAADAYTLAMDSDKTWDALNRSMDYLLFLDKGKLMDSVAGEMKLRVNSNSDSMKIIQTKFAGYAAESFKDNHVNFNPINIWELSESQITSECYWDSLMRTPRGVYMPSEILDMSAKLVQTGHEKSAKTLIDVYRKYYVNDTDGKGMFILHNILPIGRPLYAFALTSSSMRNSCLPDVEREAIDFYYNENVLHERTIRYQRDMLWALGIGGALLVTSICLVFMFLDQRRKRQNEELIRSAVELRATFKSTQDKWLGTLTHLCNTYFDAYPKESERNRTANNVMQSIHEMAESDDFFPSLERKLNLEHDNILNSFRADLPELREDEYQLLMLNALGLSIPTISLLLKEKRSVIYSRRVRLRSKIQESTSPLKEEYLRCLG